VRAGRLAAALAASAALLAAVSHAAVSAPNVERLNPALGTEDYAPGPVRVSFLLIDDQGVAVYRDDIRVRVFGPNGHALATVPVSIEPVGVSGAGTDGGDITRLYVVHFRVARPGTYRLVAGSSQGKPVRAEWAIDVRKHPRAPAVGSQAIPSQTPTIATTHGNFRELTTRTPPDKGLLRYSIAGSLAAHKPFVVVFATPKFCSSRTCGPVVDVVDAVRKRLGGGGVRFIHVEVYRDNNPGLGYNRWFKQWHLPTEPWTFLVGRDGRIRARFEGSVSVGELAAAVRKYLLT
jgi:hypothetical protein